MLHFLNWCAYFAFIDYLITFIISLLTIYVLKWQMRKLLILFCPQIRCRTRCHTHASGGHEFPTACWSCISPECSFGFYHPGQQCCYISPLAPHPLGQELNDCILHELMDDCFLKQKHIKKSQQNWCPFKTLQLEPIKQAGKSIPGWSFFWFQI